MDTGILQTKLNIPQVRPSLVRRAQLVNYLNTGLSVKLTLVSAPAGYGKSTLVAGWIRDLPLAGSEAQGRQEEPPQFCWLSLDEADNDLVRFLTYLVAALRTARPDAGEFFLETVRSPQLPPVESLMTFLINDLVLAPTPLIIVLDDYHLIKDGRIHQALAFLLDHMPSHLHIVMISRADPMIPLARLRGQGQLVELRQSDLRFSSQEAATFLNQIMGLGLTAEDVAQLNARTEGWIAGLQMAAVSLRQGKDPTGFIQAFSGSHRFVLDYLLEEVLQRQPPHIQEFLLYTAVLDRLAAPLCDYLIADLDLRDAEGEIHQSQEILDYLEGANLFVIPLDDQRGWYRYHRLFADLLRQRLRETDPERIAALEHRAGYWLWQHDLPIEAIRHTLAAGDYPMAAELIEKTAESSLSRSEVSTLITQVQSLPEELVRARVELALYYAWALLLQGAPLEQVEAGLPPVSAFNPRTAAIESLMQAFIAVFRGQLVKAKTLSQQALADLDAGEPYWRSLAAWILGMSYPSMVEQFHDDELTMEEAVRIGKESGNRMVVVSSMCEQAQMLKRQGRLQEAKAMHEQALAQAVDQKGRYLPIAGEALMGLGEIALEWNELETAEDYLNAGLEKTRQWRKVAAIPGFLLLARLRQAQQDTAGADEALQEAWQLARLFDATEYDDLIVAAQQAKTWIQQGRLDLAEAWIESRRLLDPASIDASNQVDAYLQNALRRYEEIILARLLLAQGKPELANDLLAQLLPEVTKWRHKRLLLETQLLQAQSFFALGAVDLALDALQNALATGQPGGFVQLFLDERQPVARLLQAVKPSGPQQQTYIEKLLDSFGPAHPSPPIPQSLVEPLSERELEVLQLIAEGFSNREIALELVVSLPTVKWHTSNIYGKLGVGNRTTAVAKARELRILPLN